MLINEQVRIKKGYRNALKFSPYGTKIWLITGAYGKRLQLTHGDAVVSNVYEHEIESIETTTPHTIEITDRDLGYCTVCNAGEGALTTECPGFSLNMYIRDAIYKGGLDYAKGKWTVKP
jgi:hypothetical protein